MTLSMSFMIALLLIFVRTVSLIGTAPLFGNAQIPSLYKIGLAAYLAFVVAVGLPSRDIGGFASIGLPWLIVLIMLEAFTGIALGMMAGVVFAAIQFAGELLDMQVGFSMANVMSPGSLGPSGLLSNLYYVIFGLWFLSINGHHAVILALFYSFKIIPLGAAVFNGSVAQVMLRALVSLFLLGVQLSAPVMLSLFLTNLSMAVASRAVPQMNVFVVGLPVTLLVGWAAIFVVLPGITTVMQGAVTAFDQQIASMISALRGVGG